jgi:DNA-binding NarL/FixJ family response regulator
MIEAERDIEVVGDVATVAEALQVTRQEAPDILLTDIRLSGDVNGVELARVLREENPDVKIIVLTNYSNEPYVRAMMEVGVAGYILKDTTPREVIESMRMVMEGTTVFSNQIAQTLVSGYLAPNRFESATASRITDREEEVLRLLAGGLSNAEITEQLSVSVGTVQFHLGNIYGKLGVRSRGEAVTKAARKGLVVMDE